MMMIFRMMMALMPMTMTVMVMMMAIAMMIDEPAATLKVAACLTVGGAAIKV